MSKNKGNLLKLPNLHLRNKSYENLNFYDDYNQKNNFKRNEKDYNCQKNYFSHEKNKKEDDNFVDKINSHRKAFLESKKLINKKIIINKNDNINAIENKQSTFKNSLEKINPQIIEYEENINKLNSKIENLNYELKSKDNEIKKSKEEIKILKLKMNMKINDLKNRDIDINKLKDEKIILENELEKAKKRISELELKTITKSNLFPKGEQYCQLIKDININNKEENSIVEHFLIFFTLKDVFIPNKKYSFGVSINNSSKIDNPTFLGYLENKIGNNIDFGTIFQIDYFKERNQTIIIAPIIDGEETGNKIKYHVKELMKSPDNKLEKNIEKIGTLQISYLLGKNQNNLLSNEITSFEFYISLNNKDLFGGKNKLNNSFYVIRNFKDGLTKRAIYKSNEYDFEINKVNITSLISFDSDILCNEKNDSIFFELYCPSIDKKNYIGFASFNLNQLEENLKADKFLSVKIKNDRYGPIGKLKINYNIKEKMDFQKIKKINQFNLDIAIDYSKSNGEQNDPNSLHYINGENDYEKAIKSCGKILSYFDYDQLVPIYGFGGIPQGEQKVNHCFNIKLNAKDPYIKKDMIIDYYKESLNKIKLSYPTYFSQIIKKVVEEINYDLNNKKEENHYYILLIFTDGTINDTQETIDSIVEASKLPLSIVIIGIGNNDFTSMEILDGDEKPLTNSFGEKRKRDIVQFVRFNKFKDKINCGSELDQVVFKEIPRQVEEYYQFFGKIY